MDLTTRGRSKSGFFCGAGILSCLRVGNGGNVLQCGFSTADISISLYCRK
jgi:hypothetical protein